MKKSIVFLVVFSVLIEDFEEHLMHFLKIKMIY